MPNMQPLPKCCPGTVDGSLEGPETQEEQQLEVMPTIHGILPEGFQALYHTVVEFML